MACRSWTSPTNSPRTQVVWGVVIFAILYVLASRTALPKVAAVLEERAKRIAGDLEGASDPPRRAPTRGIARRRRTAYGEGSRRSPGGDQRSALDSSKQAAAAQATVLNERLDRQLKEAEGQIAAARGAALAALPGVATDTAVALITRLTGAAPDPARLAVRRDQRRHGRARRRPVRGNADA